MKKIKIAIIGAGSIAKEHARAFAALPDVELVGIYSRTRAKADVLARELNIARVFDSIESLYAQTDADGVVVAVPILETEQVVATVLQYPWASLIEKPVGYTLKQAIEIAKMAKEQHRKCFVALNRRHYSSTRTVLNDMESSNEQRFVQIFDQEEPIVARECGQPDLVIDNWMFANSIHVIDYLSLFCRGYVQTVEQVVPWDAGSSSFVVTKFVFSSGDIGLYQAVWDAPGPWAVTVTTKSKRWELRPLEQAIMQQQGSRRMIPTDVDPKDKEFKAGFFLQAQEFLLAVSDQESKLPTLDIGVRTMELVEAIYGA